MSDVQAVTPIFPVRRDAHAVEHYSALGFEITGDEGYRFARRGDTHIHLAKFEDLDPSRNVSAAYLYVTDADALRDEWLAAGVGGRIHPIRDTPYGLRESAHVDPDGNLVRFGSWLRTPGPGRQPS